MSKEFLNESVKQELLGKIVAFIDVFEGFKESYNSDFLLKSLNYLSFVLLEEKFDNTLEHDLLEYVSMFVGDVEKIYSFRVNTTDIFDKFDIGFLKDLFAQLKDYIESELNFTPEFDKTLLGNQTRNTELIDFINSFEPFIPLKSEKLTFDDMVGFHINFDDFSRNSFPDLLDAEKKKLTEKLCDYIRLSSKLETCYNSSLIGGSADYLRIVLREENIDYDKKEVLFNLIYRYLEEIDKILLIDDKNPEIFGYLNLYVFDVFFDRLQNYISQILKILPRGDDENFDLSLCYY